MKIPPIGYLAIAVISMSLVSKIISTAAAKPLCDTASNLERISCGEEIILMPPGGKIRRDKELGFTALKQKDYIQAIESLQRDWEVAKDPETLIALNNAKLAQTADINIKTIAVVVPSSQTPIFVANNMLKGVAAAQREWNQGNRAWKLRVIVADDSNDPNEGKKIASELVKHPEILTVLGHYSSNVTVNVRDIYQQAKTVLLSPTSTADELTTIDSNSYFFRIASSNRVSAQEMANNWANKYDKIALFYTPNKKFSESLRKAFLSATSNNRIVKEFDLTVPNHAADEIAQAKAAGAKAIVIIPDAYTDAIERDRVLSIIKANQGKLPILGSSILRDAYLFQVNPEWLKNLTISVPLHASDRRYIDAGKLNQAPNWWGNKSQIHDRIINSYDGMQVLLSALDKATDREDIRIALRQPNFTVRGITGKISFKGSDRAENINTLVIPDCDANKCERFKPAL
jgi:ABC-type branched-subunit amino acid transport system substrate-binding protein